MTKTIKRNELAIFEELRFKIPTSLSNEAPPKSELKKIDTKDVEPMLSVFNESMPQRDDKASKDFTVDEILKNPEIFGNALFQLRADDLINSRGSEIYKSKLSGYLLGLELLGSLEFWKNNDIVLIGNVDLIKLYENVLTKKVSSIQKFNSEDMVLKGLQHFKDKLN